MESKTHAEIRMKPPVEIAFVPDHAELDILIDAAIACAAPTDAIKDSGERLSALVRAFGDAKLLSLFDSKRATPLAYARERLAMIHPLYDLAFAMQGLGSFAISKFGSASLCEQWMPCVVDGSAVAAFALTEPNAGSDLGKISTTATKDGDEYILDGEKHFITNAGIAAFYTLFAVTNAGGGKRRLSAFAVPADASGLSTASQHVLGDHPIGHVFLRDARISKACLIGEEGQGLEIALATLERFRPTVGAAALGLAERAFQETLAYVKTREQFGAPLANRESVQRLISEMACDLDAARLLVYRAAWTAERDSTRAERTRTGSMAKLFATEAAQRVIDHAVQLHGGRGVLRESVVAMLYEEVRSLRIYEGASEVHHLLIAREALR